MKRIYGTITWTIEHHGPCRVACLVPDHKGRLAEMCVRAGVKKQKFFTYTGIGVPAEVRNKLGAEFPAANIRSLDAPKAVNVDLAFIAEPAHRSLVWHNPIVLEEAREKPHGNAAMLPVQPDPRDEPSFMWITPANALPTKQFQVKTRNCVDDPEIQKNVNYSMQLGLPHLPRIAAHGYRAVVASAGRSLVNHWDDLRREVDNDARLICVKHSHDALIAQDLIPWACILLDPRGHVKDFVEEPDPRVMYFVSSTCHPTTFDRLLSRGARVWLYHALVGAGETPLIEMRNRTVAQTRSDLQAAGLQLPAEEPYWKQDRMVSGGTTSASRGISVLHLLGFREFGLYGYDSCYWEKPDLKALKDDGQPMYHELSLGGRKFWTDAELVAQVQDFQHMVGVMEDVKLDVYGEGMIPHLVRNAPPLSEPFEQWIGAAQQ